VKKAVFIILLLAEFTLPAGVMAESADGRLSGLWHEVDAAFDAGEYKQVLSLLGEIRAIIPDSRDAAEDSGFALWSLSDGNDFDDAMRFLLEAERADSVNSDVYYVLADMFSLRGDYLRAQLEFGKALYFGFRDFDRFADDPDLEGLRSS